MATGYVEEAYESIPGNESNAPTLSAKKLTAPFINFQATLNPSPMDRDDENRNTDEPVPVLEEAHNPGWSDECRAYPDVLAFRLKSMLGAPVTTAGNGVITDPDSVAIPAGATRHVWTSPFGPAGASPQTFQAQVAYKDQSAFFKLKGAATEQLGIGSPEQGGCRITRSGKAAYMVKITDPAITPSYEALTVKPFMRSGLTLPTWLASTGATDDVDFSLAQAVAMRRSLGIASFFPDVVEKDEGPLVLTGSIAKSQLDTDDYDALKAATGFSVKAKWLSQSIITGAYAYQLWIQLDNAQYVGGELDALMNKRRHGARFNFKASRNAGAAVTITLVNATASYA